MRNTELHKLNTTLSVNVRDQNTSGLPSVQQKPLAVDATHVARIYDLQRVCVPVCACVCVCVCVSPHTMNTFFHAKGKAGGRFSARFRRRSRYAGRPTGRERGRAAPRPPLNHSFVAAVRAVGVSACTHVHRSTSRSYSSSQQQHKQHKQRPTTASREPDAFFDSRALCKFG